MFLNQIVFDNLSMISEAVANDVSLCEYPMISGDGICDDEANIHTCDFDDGDCCGEDIRFDRCLQCMCLGNI